MLCLTHAVTGAALGTQLGNPSFAFLGGVGLHIVLDKIPHFWPNSKKGKALVMWIDAVLTIIFMVSIIYFGGPLRNLILAGALGGVAVDVLLVLTPLYKSKVGQWHSGRQLHLQKYIYYLTDVALILIGLFVVWSIL